MRPLGHLTAGARSACARRAEEGVRPPLGDRDGGTDAPAPPGSREEWLRLVEAIAPRLCLGDKALRALRVIVTACRWSDFAGCGENVGQPPVCFRQQQRMAEAIGVTPGHFRRLEAALEKAGLIERRTCENGHRGRLAPGPGAPVAGLSLAPMLVGLPRWRAIERAMRREAEALAEGRAMIRIERRATRRAIQPLGEDHPLRRRYDTLRGAGFRPAARFETGQAIAEHLDELRRLIEEARDAAPRAAPDVDGPGLDDTILHGGACSPARRYTEDTTYPQGGSCSGAPGDEGDAPVGRQCPADGSGSCREGDGETVGRAREAGRRRSAEEDAESDAEMGAESGATIRSALPPALLARLTPAVLRELGSDELRLYVDHLEPRPPGQPPTLRDIERAALMRRRELGITPQAWEEIEDALGWLDALVALIVVDRNQGHPRTPVRNPGGLLRDLARRRRAGTLDLAASVMGAWRRGAS